MKLILISGLSGAGKSVALHMLEDIGYYCVDNIPAALLRPFVELTLNAGDKAYDKVAVGVDARNRATDIAMLPELVVQLRAENIPCEILFLYCDEDVLFTRYSETRRRHPLSSRAISLRDALAEEEKLLQPVSDAADLIIDTTRTTVHELRELVRERLAGKDSGKFSLLFESFGFKHGVPGNADFVFDVRCLPNPYWETSLRLSTGLDEPVKTFLRKHEMVAKMVTDIGAFLDNWLDICAAGDRSYLTVAIGCTGGRHRSVYVAEELAERFREKYSGVLTRHGEIAGR